MFRTLLALLSFVTFSGMAAERTVKVEKRYLNIPVSHTAELGKMQLDYGEPGEKPFHVRLTDGKPDYWVFRDMASFKGRELHISYDGKAEGLAAVYQSDEIPGADSLYKEKYRPQIHYTSRVGWMNDPNGLLWHDGEYHLFYQHNPYEREWGNMHWGHAVSRDLVHWQELPIALYPDSLGVVFSGSAVMDPDNTAGFNRDGKIAMVALYTSEGAHQSQSIAYSLDNGRTFTRYAGNPVIDSNEEWQTRDTRDPKVFWYAPGKHWVMVLFERDGQSIYTSADLKAWKYESHNEVFWECPELFELPVDGDPKNTKWVMYGASGTYMLGSFDGRKFTPENGKFYFQKGNIYAGQTITSTPDGRRIQIGWGTVSHPGMAFKSMMTLPAELCLRATPNGVRLFSTPIEEVYRLRGESRKWSGLSLEQANEILASYQADEPLYVRFTAEPHDVPVYSLALNGRRLLEFEMNFNLVNSTFYSPQKFDSKVMSAELFIDRTSVETYVDGGGLNITMQREANLENREGLRFHGPKTRILELEIAPMNSIWK